MRWMLSVLLLLVQACATAPQKAPAKKAKPVAIAKPKPLIKKPVGLELKHVIKPDPVLPSEFFNISRGSLVLGVYYDEQKFNEGDHFQAWLKDRSVIRRTEPVEKLASLGIKKGDVIQYLNFETNRVDQYEIKDKVNLIMNDYENPEQGDPGHYRTFHLWLNDIPEKHDFPDSTEYEQVTGIAYKGSVYKLKPNSLTFVPEHASIVTDDKEVQDIYKVVKKYLSQKIKEFEGGEMVQTDENRELFLLEAKVRVVGPVTDFSFALNPEQFSNHYDWDNNGFETIVRVGENSLYNVTYNDPSYETRNVDGILKYMNIIEEADMVFFEEEDSSFLDNICSSIFIVKGDVIEQHYLRCQPGGC
jgi:hypothetical protein